ncbi:MAG: RagB/SusD family nutrient uptake outer membrane protein, partial [Candidatus Amulumruptor sp.]|nr:RagB/SusD family nutrient uptake outer membrane protein [Candidatus Amulumruptor sp.]
MKAKYLIPLAMAFGLTAQSCGDFLDTDPAAIYSEDLVWGSAANVEAFVLGQYGNVMQYYRNVTMDKDFTNNMIACRSAAPNTVRGLMENTYDAGINGRFGTIRACNMIIERCSNSTVLDDIDKRKYTAIGKLMRAMVYYDLARKTGKFIWVDKVL